MLMACNIAEEPAVTNTTEDDPLLGEEPVDSIQLNLLELDDLPIVDFSARIPGFIWGSTYVEDGTRRQNVLFS